MTRRAVTYARFSSDLQRNASITDQQELCRRFAMQNRLEIIADYFDKARSGASMMGRDGLQDLMADAKAGRFEVVLVESLDRLSRDQEDLAGLFKRPSFFNIEIIQVHGGRADTMQIGLRGIMGAMYLKDLADKTKRGMEGRVREGKIAGGKPYAYRPLPGRPGEFEIVEEEADIVRRIFAAYATGQSTRTIAAALNRDGVPAPRGAVWTPSAINGGRKRNVGILRVELYRGRIVWGKARYIRDPDTGKRLSRMNPESEWHTAEASQLRIVDDNLWNAVAERLGTTGRTGTSLNRPKRKHLLTGLLRCGECGGGMVMNGVSRGRYRIVCSRYREARACTHSRTYYLDCVEEIVVGALRTLLAEPYALQAFVDEYVGERRRMIADMTKLRNRAQADYAKAKAARSRMEDHLIWGRVSPEKFDQVRPGLNRQIALAESELSRVAEPPRLDLHPEAVRVYKEAVDNLQRILHTGAEGRNEKLMAPVRDLVHSVVIKSRPTDAPLSVEILGKLAALTGDRSVANLLVAGARNKQYRNGQLPHFQPAARPSFPLPPSQAAPVPQYHELRSYQRESAPASPLQGWPHRRAATSRESAQPFLGNALRLLDAA